MKEDHQVMAEVYSNIASSEKGSRGKRSVLKMMLEVFASKSG